MKNIKKATLTLIALFCFTLTFSQQKVIIRGRVIDKSDKSAVIGANIVEYDKDNRVINGTTCDLNGDFVLELKNVSNVIRISFIGYVTSEIKPTPGASVTIELAPAVREIQEVVVTAFAQTKRNTLTNLDDRDKATSSVKIDLMESKETGALSIADALQGRVSGLDILNASGDPGAGSRIVIRGLSSIGNSKPLIVIDGIPQSSPPDYGDFNLGSANVEDIGTLLNISVQDIKSIEVLKDAASTAAYGSKGADGVLQIETHKGKKGAVKIDYTYKRSWNFQPPAIPMLNGDEYIMLQQEQWHNRDGIYDLPAEIDYANDNMYIRNNYTKNTDWIKAITQNNTTDDHYINLSGGGEKATYFTSLSFIDAGGTTVNTGSKTFSTRLNLDYSLSKKIMFNIQFSFTHRNTDQNMSINDRGVREMAYIKAPNMSIWEYDAGGNLTGEYFTPINSYQGDGLGYYNPVAVAELGNNDILANALTNSFSVRYSIAPWLTFVETASIEFGGSKEQAYLPYKAIGTDFIHWLVNKADEQNKINQSFKTQTQLLYNIPFSNVKHQLTGALTWNTDQERNENMFVQSNMTPSVDIQDPSINAQINWIGSFLSEKRFLEGVFSANYKYDDKYMVQAILTEDAHTSFGKNNRWGLFYGISGAWRFSKENFVVNKLPFIGESKLKVSWGTSGRQPDNSYVRFATYGDPSTVELFFDTYYGSHNLPKTYLGLLGVVPTQIQLSNLRWANTKTLNLALELNLFNNKLYALLETYNKVTTDLLFKDYEIPSSAGFQTLKYFNGGELANKGWEVMLSYKFLERKNLLLSFNFNISQNENRFTMLPENFNNENSTTVGNGDYPRIIVEGEPIGSFYGFRYKGVYASDGDAVAKDADGNILQDATGARIPMTYKGSYVFRGGDSKYEDINHDGKIDLNDVVYIGNSNPKFYGGFGPYVKYKNFNFSCQFQYRLGYDIINMIALQTQGMTDRNNQSKAVLRRWRAQGDNNPDLLPRAYMNSEANNLGSDRYVEKGSYLRLLNAQVGYSLSPQICQKLKIRSMKLSLSSMKLATFTNYSGQDPEVPQDASDPFWIGADKSRTPPPRVMTFAVSIGF